MVIEIGTASRRELASRNYRGHPVTKTIVAAPEWFMMREEMRLPATKFGFGEKKFISFTETAPTFYLLHGCVTADEITTYVNIYDASLFLMDQGAKPFAEFVQREFLSYAENGWKSEYIVEAPLFYDKIRNYMTGEASNYARSLDDLISPNRHDTITRHMPWFRQQALSLANGNLSKIGLVLSTNQPVEIRFRLKKRRRNGQVKETAAAYAEVSDGS